MSSAVVVQPSSAAPVHIAREQFYSPSTSASSSSFRKPSTRASNVDSYKFSPQSHHQRSPISPDNSYTTTPRAQPQPLSNHASPSSTLSTPALSVPPRSSSQRPSSSLTTSSYTTAPPTRPDQAGTMTDSDLRTRPLTSPSSRHAPSAARDPQFIAATGQRRSSVSREDGSSHTTRLGPGFGDDVVSSGNRTTAGQSQPADVANEAYGLADTPNSTSNRSNESPLTRQSRQNTRPEGRRKEVRFGDYILGQTLGEGEFGKVKMGWKRDGSAQVAIKLIRREVLGSNPTRLPKIYREINILRQLEHPNIVRLHEMVETERHIGIILEYASGGELFDYILQHRYLKDNAARRLFAQLISGVGYLHKKGIVHRDLKLENLLLDRSRNIIITDFGFANTFESDDELSDEIIYNITDKDFVNRLGLDQVNDQGHRRGDLMQTSCGSPCYAAPELVVTDSLYTGRKVDVWSCGVILYAMLAGYLPFDDDPANPEGDNINLLYRYIVSTPLLFPEYVTPHARDLLKRILVPDPRKRADLFEIARHSWLSEYVHVVGFITSSSTSPKDIANTTVPSALHEQQPLLVRSASVREPTSKSHPNRQAVQVGALAPKRDHIDSIAEVDKQKSSRETKRRTVQVEYVAPQPLVGATDVTATATHKARPGSQVAAHTRGDYEVHSGVGNTATATQSSTRPSRDQLRAASENVILTQRQITNGNPAIFDNLPSRASRASRGQPATALARDQAHGRMSQLHTDLYNHDARRAGDRRSLAITGDYRHDSIDSSQPVTAQVPDQLTNARGHRRSNTLGGLGERLGFGQRGSWFGGKADEDDKPKKSKKYPPVSMSRPIPNDSSASATPNPAEPRRSSESRRTSFSFRRRSNAAIDANAEPTQNNRSSRRFSSLIPSFGRKEDKEANRQDQRPRMAFGQGESRASSHSAMHDHIPVLYDSQIDSPQYTIPIRKPADKTAPEQLHSYPSQQPYGHSQPPVLDHYSGRQQTSAGTPPQEQQQYRAPQHKMAPGTAYDDGAEHLTDSRQSTEHTSRHESRPSMMHKRRNFNYAYEQDGGHSGSSGAAKRVMALFTFRRKPRNHA